MSERGRIMLLKNSETTQKFKIDALSFFND